MQNLASIWRNEYDNIMILKKCKVSDGTNVFDKISHHRIKQKHGYPISYQVILAGHHDYPSYSKTTRQASFAWWRHQMETFCALLAICAGNSPVPQLYVSGKRPMLFWNMFATNLQIPCWIQTSIGLQCESSAMASQWIMWWNRHIFPGISAIELKMPYTRVVDACSLKLNWRLELHKTLFSFNSTIQSNTLHKLLLGVVVRKLSEHKEGCLPVTFRCGDCDAI